MKGIPWVGFGFPFWDKRNVHALMRHTMRQLVINSLYLICSYLLLIYCTTKNLRYIGFFLKKISNENEWLIFFKNLSCYSKIKGLVHKIKEGKGYRIIISIILTLDAVIFIILISKNMNMKMCAKAGEIA